MRFGRKKKHYLEVTLVLAVVLFLLFLAVVRTIEKQSEARGALLGLTFSSLYAEELGLDWRRAYLAVLDELKPPILRLPVYWHRLSQSAGFYDWADLDWMISEAAARQTAVTLAIGRKVPRWPECFEPDWVSALSDSERHLELLIYLRVLIERYEDEPAVVRWQIENEPFYPFGDCPIPDSDLFEEEIALAREISQKPIMLTASGENESWTEMAGPADVLGISLYKTTWNDLTGYFVYPFGSGFYRLKAALARPLVDELVLAELQAEPWFRADQQDETAWRQAKLFTAEDLETRIKTAWSVGFDEIYLWGVEWWYWLAVQGQDELWRRGACLISSRLCE